MSQAASSIPNIFRLLVLILKVPTMTAATPVISISVTCLHLPLRTAVTAMVGIVQLVMLVITPLLTVIVIAIPVMPAVLAAM